MPRQLPWASKAGSSRTQVKAPPRPAKKPRMVSDIDDDFFDGTRLAGSKKGKERSVDPDDDLTNLAVEPTTPSTNLLRRNPHSADRAPSSSPPPIADLDEPTIEPMRKGVSKFDLRDDEWMMVEDEFLETAKLFTRHLHIAEYERLKEKIEAKKQEAEIARPVVPNTKLSFQSAIKEKAKVQEKKQRNAIRDVFANQDEDLESFTTRTSFSRPIHPPAASDSNSDNGDLDAIRPPPRHALPSKSALASISNRHPTTGLQKTPTTSSSSKPSTLAQPNPNPHQTAPPPSFKNPVLPTTTTTTTKPRTRPQPRTTPFDMLDDYAPKNHPPQTPSKEPLRHATPVPKQPGRVFFPATSSAERNPHRTSAIGKSAHMTTGSGDWGVRNTVNSTTGTSSDGAERLAKRKVEREKEDRETDGDKARRKVVRLDDIPTFLF
ncbi:hypothetical protein T440DRAFT_463758 [Plenodomus tracheiphilus IPT5]|uniref:Uncharacterized protein n=1 Tax=Plenodomus tracheiphilus IPT5 TaxID=1408161 RepID=A0A6A7BM04_9PLEO|nr:hypothetical protein T440DRAFT_463758 [Plenodomus tracheiphilus IPT5]